MVYRKHLIVRVDYPGMPVDVRYYREEGDAAESKPRAAWETEQNGRYDSPHQSDYWDYMQRLDELTRNAKETR